MRVAGSPHNRGSRPAPHRESRIADRRRLLTRLAVALLAAGLVASLVACGADEPAADTTAPPTTGQGTVPGTTTAAPEAEQTVVRVYLLRGEHLAVGTRRVPRTTAVAAAALEELLSGPSAEEEAAGLGSAVPEGTELRSVTIADGVATVDLSGTYESGGGSASMLARVAQVVYTATQFPTVDAVRFRLDGEPVEAIGGEGVVVDPPVGRGDFETLLPPILVETPAVADVVTSPLRVAGTASVFEATLSVTLTGPDGATLAEQVVTATEGAPSRGDFETTLEFDAPAGPATVTAFTRSAADNSVQHAVEIPVELAG